jgi:PAS domain S-box-containing protein
MAGPKTTHGSLRRWMPLASVLAVSGSLLTAAALIVRHIHEEAMGQWRSRIELAADDRRASIERTLLAGLADAGTLAAYPTAIFLAAGEPRAVPFPFPAEQGPRVHLQMLLASYVDQHGYRSVWLLDAQGSVLAGVGPRGGPRAECLAHAMRTLASARQPPEMHLHDGASSALSFAAPVHATSPWAGARSGVIGVVLLEGDAVAKLGPLMRERDIGMRTGEALLARQDGDEVVSLLPTRHSPSGTRMSAGTARLASTAALGEEATFGSYEDDRGQRVIAATRRLRTVPWGLVVKVDRSEALAGAYGQAAAALAVALALTAGAAGVGYGVWRGRRARYLIKRRREDEEKRWLLRVIEQTPASIVVTDTSGQIEYVNPRFTAVTGFAAEEVLGRNPRLLKSGLTPPEVYRDLWGRITSGGVWEGQLLNRRKDGTHFWEEARISGVRDPDGRLTHYVAVKEDITARKEAETALRATQDQLLQAQKMEAVGRLAGGIAHDFNNLLGVILGYAGMLARSLEAGDPQRQRVEQIQKASQRAAALTRQLLAFSRRQILQPRPVDLAATVHEMDTMLRRVIGEDIELVATASEGHAVVMVDPGQMDQVLMNLVLNARDAMPRGGRLTVSTEVVHLRDARAWSGEAMPDGVYAALRVRDTGSGMPPEVQERLFEPFFTTKPVGEGTGLGLPTVYGIVRQSGGYVDVESEVGEGSVFTVFLPLLRQPAEEAQPVPERPLRRGSETVLVVEDQEALRQVTAELLAELGYTVLQATSGEEALQVAVTHPGRIDVLLTDVVMSGMSGTELAEAIRRARPALRALFVSGHPGAVVARHGTVVDPSLLLQKPFSADVLANKIRQTLDGPLAAGPSN